MSKLTVTPQQNGYFPEFMQLRQLVETVFGPFLKKAGLAIVKTEMKNTPKVSGHLRRGWALEQIEWKGNLVKITAGNAVIYARRVNKTSRKNKGYVERGLNDGRSQALDLLKQGARALAPHLWVQK